MVLETAAGVKVSEVSAPLGRATNNVAEYRALLAALEVALDGGHSRLKVFSDSELLVRQVQGRYKVKSLDLRPLYDAAREMIARFESFSIEYVPRERNREADRLANKTLDRAQPLAREGL